jgi:hypothetical protein
MKQLDLARALGLSQSTVSDYARRGMPMTSPEAARSWMAGHVRTRMRPIAAAPAAAPPAAPQLDPAYVDGLDDGWAAAFRALAEFAARHGIERFGPAAVAVMHAMPIGHADVDMSAPKAFEDALDAIQAEHDRLVAAGKRRRRGAS